MLRPASSRDHTTGRRRRRRVGLAATTAGILLTLAPTASLAAPAPPNPTDGQIAAAQATQQAASAEVGRLAGLVAAAETDLERITSQAEAASDAYRIAQGQAQQAQEAADAAAGQLRTAEEGVTAAQAQVAVLGRASYMRHDTMAGAAALLDAAGPRDLLERAATLQRLGVQRVDVLGQLRTAQALQADAAARAQSALLERQSAAQKAAQAKDAADAQLAASRTAYNDATAQKTAYEQQLQQAQINLLRLQGARNAYQAWQDQQARQRAQEAAAASAAAQANAAAAAAARTSAPGSSGGRGVAPTSGVFTTCFEMRWGVMHWGVDIAAPIGTPIYAPAAGQVLRAGPATGFGLAVYIQHDDGTVTVYGHINDYFVTAGQRVTAGQQIAEVGNKGESTGPHLHFEVATDGPYAGRVDPIPWLAARGVDMGGRCR